MDGTADKRHCAKFRLHQLNDFGNITIFLLLRWPLSLRMYTVSQKNDNDVLRYNFNAHQPILIIFGRYIAE